MSNAPLPTPQEISALPSDGGDEFNRLIFEASPYLRQHARNPVDWHPWGEEAFSLARELDRPIFLSVGYSTCHWCHVMERESFENPGIAEAIGRDFIAIKVDREERPDVDEIHMKATQLMTGHGGWPNSVWLTPDLRPWYAGTYFPPEDRPGRTGFGTLLAHLARIWREQRGEVEEQAKQLADAVTDACSGGETDPVAEPPGRRDVERLLDELERSFDANFGGFGGAPKFPPHGSLRILAEEVAAKTASESEVVELRSMLISTLDALRSGGIHDQIGGGFHRYSTDREWLLPHFEKMLYDNAQLLSVFARGEALAIEGMREAAEGIVAWVEREMTSPGGGFYAALDADSEGVEGKCYVWEPEEVRAVLGEERGARFCQAYDITEDGNFTDEATGEHPGTSVPRVLRSHALVAEDLGIEVATFREELAEGRARLLEVRDRRVPPHLDDKVVTSWCALFASALAEAGACFGEPIWIERGARSVEFLLAEHVIAGTLHRSSREGTLGPLAFLEDHAALGLACLDLEAAGARAPEKGSWRGHAQHFAATIRERFTHPGGGFYDASEDHDHLLVRPRDPFDPAMPSGNGLAARLFHRLSVIDEDGESGEIADRALLAFASSMRRAPRGTESLIEIVSARSAETASSTPAAGGVVESAWAEGTVRLTLDRLSARRGESLGVAIDGSFGKSGKWQHGGSEGASLSLEAPGFQLEITLRRGTSLEGRVTAGAEVPDGAHRLAFTFQGEPCREELCLPAVTIELSVPVLIESE